MLLLLVFSCRGLTVNDVTTGESPAYPELVSLFPNVPPKLAYERAVLVAEQMEDWQNCAPSAPLTLHCEAVTPTLGFVDDLWITVEPYGPKVSRVQMRSRSRSGRGDLGANARRILAFQAAYQEQD